MSLLKLVIDISATTAVDVDSETCVHQHDESPSSPSPSLVTPAAVPASPVDGSTCHVDDATTQPADDQVQLNTDQPPTDDDCTDVTNDDDVIDDSGYCFEDDVEGEYAADVTDLGGHDYRMPVYKTDIEKGQPLSLLLLATLLDVILSPAPSI